MTKVTRRDQRANAARNARKDEETPPLGVQSPPLPLTMGSGATAATDPQPARRCHPPRLQMSRPRRSELRRDGPLEQPKPRHERRQDRPPLEPMRRPSELPRGTSLHQLRFQDWARRQQTSIAAERTGTGGSPEGPGRAAATPSPSHSRGPPTGAPDIKYVMHNGQKLCPDFQHGRCATLGKECHRGLHRCGGLLRSIRVCGMEGHCGQECRHAIRQGTRRTKKSRRGGR